MKKKIFGIITTIAVVLFTGCVFGFLKKPESVKAEIQNKFILMAKENANTPMSSEIIASSNPFDYVDSKYYEEIVSMGTKAIEPLEELLYSDEIDGVYKYVGAVALQDITECDLSKITGVDWSNVEQFKELWNITIQDMPETFQNIQNNSKMSLEQKMLEIEKYGVFGKTYAKGIASGKFIFGDNKLQDIDDIMLKNKFKKFGENIGNEDSELIIGYMQEKQNKTN